MDRKEACKILGVSENATLDEIRKAYKRLSLKHHPDKSGQQEKFQEINKAHEFLTKDNDNSDNSGIDEDAIWLMKQKIENALDYNNVKKEEMDDETIRHYEEKLRKCKTKEDLEKFTSEVVFFIQIYARARNAGYFDDKGNASDKWKKSKPAPATETRSNTSSSSPKYEAFTCDYCGTRVGSDDPRPKYTFKGVNKAFCHEKCREYWDKNDQWEKEWEQKQKKEAQEWEDYKRKQDQKWADYFSNLNSSSPKSYSSYTYTPSSSGSSGSSDLSSWLKEWKQSQEKYDSERLKSRKQKYIRDVEFALKSDSVSEEKLNQRLKVKDWREKINECSNMWEALGRSFDLKNLIYDLSREYTCANCGKEDKSSCPWKKNGKKYCSLDCMDGKKNDDETKKLKEEIQELKDALKDLVASVDGALKEILSWVRKERIISISLENDKLVVNFGAGYKNKTLEDSALTPGQSGLKKYFQKSGKKSLSASEIEKIVNGEINQEGGKDKKNDKNGKAGIIVAVVIVALVVAVIIGVIIGKSKGERKDY